MKLQSMTDFVIVQNLLLANNEITHNECGLRILKYANFLKQPLTLGMFVPCDEEGNVLEKLIYSDQVHIYLNYYEKQDYVKRCNDYKKAKEKVLFEGFQIISNEEGIIELEGRDIFINYNIEEGLFFLDSWNGDAVIMNLECLCNLLNNTASSVELTESAIKQIGL